MTAASITLQGSPGDVVTVEVPPGASAADLAARVAGSCPLVVSAPPAGRPLA